VGNGIYLAEMAEITGLLKRFLSYSAEINIFDRGVSQFLGIVLDSQTIEAVVGNFGDADVCFARIGRRRRKMSLGEDPK